MTIAEFDDPRLAAVYEAINTHDPGAQPRFVATVAAQTGAGTIVDLGCGTGLISRQLASAGYEVVGIDPSAAMLAVARERPFGDRVDWRLGGADAADRASADLAIMTSHVAQFFVGDDEWRAALTGLHDALRPGGRLAFESRDPRAREWERWTPANRTTFVDPVAGPIETWSDARPPVEGIVDYANHYRFLATGEELVSVARLRFRSRDELRRSLAAAGFTIERIDGDWDGRPVGEGTPELIVVASR